MKAAWYERTGAAREVLQVGELDTPAPSLGEVRVRMHWSGVNPTDVRRRGGWNQFQMSFPRVIPHMDGSGVVDQVGPGSDRVGIGQRVWLHRAEWKRPFGTAAEYTVAAQERVVPLPAGVDLRAGATLGIPAQTAHRAVFAFGPIRGCTVLVTGGGGAVGFYAIQLARWGGARVLATTSGGRKSDDAIRAGAEAVIDYRREDVAARVLAMTGGVGVDHVVDVDFGVNLPAMLEIVKPHGSIATYASMGNPNPRLPYYVMQSRALRVLFVALYDLPQSLQEVAAADIYQWLQSGSLHLPSLHEFELSDIATAHEAVEATWPGKVLIRMPQAN